MMEAVKLKSGHHLANDTKANDRERVSVFAFGCYAKR